MPDGIPDTIGRAETATPFRNVIAASSAYKTIVIVGRGASGNRGRSTIRRLFVLLAQSVSPHSRAHQGAA